MTDEMPSWYPLAATLAPSQVHDSRVHVMDGQGKIFALARSNEAAALIVLVMNQSARRDFGEKPAESLDARKLKLSKPSLAESANALAALLASILRMSDDVKHAQSPLDRQGKLLAMQNSLQKNGARAAPYAQAVIDAVNAERAKQQQESGTA